MKLGYSLIAAVLLAGCQTRVITKTETVEVKVPVHTPCVRKPTPEEVKALRDIYGREAWNKLSTDQRERLLGSNALLRKAYGDRLATATAGCQ